MLTKQEIRQLGMKEMMEELQKSRRELLKSQFEMRMGTSKEIHTVKNLRRYIARLETIKKEDNKKEQTGATASVPTKAPEKENGTPAKAKKSATKKTSTKKTVTKKK